MTIFWSKFTGRFAPYFWGMSLLFCNPLPILSLRRTRNLWNVDRLHLGYYRHVAGTICDVVPTLTNPRLPNEDVLYSPTWVEWSVLPVVSRSSSPLHDFTKIFPIVSIWK